MANDYIATTADTHGLDTITYADLIAADFAFNKTFCFRFSDKQSFVAEQVIRIIPKRRLVVFGTWQGKPAVAKLFFDASPKSHMEKDIAGISVLQNNKVPTPSILHQGHSEDKKVYVIIFERILYSQSLEEIWQERQNTEEVLPILKEVIIEIATQHVLGLLQHDLHLKNFLLTDKTVYTLDGAQIQIFPDLLEKKISIKNLVLFLSQLGADSEKYQQLLFKHYAQARGWTLKASDYLSLFAKIKKYNETRWKKYERKIFRNATHFVQIKKFKKNGMYNRNYETPGLLALLDNPESLFSSRPDILKAGNSATVIKIKIDGRDYVVKRYNMKNFFHRLRRFFRTTRAEANWRLANKLDLFGIPTAKPVAYVENNVLGVRGVSYYMMEYISGEDAGDYFKRNINQPQKTLNMVERISSLLRSVAKIQITHGDLKITNILVNSAEQSVLIDLDGAREHESIATLVRGWQKELKRFLANFDSNPELKKLFEAELAKW